MSGSTFIVINDDRLMVRLDAIIAVEELGEHDIDVRTGRLALGIPEGSVAKVVTDHATFYVKTTYDEMYSLIQAVIRNG